MGNAEKVFKLFVETARIEFRREFEMEVLLAIFATFFVRAIGFLREAIMAAIFGTSSLGDAFIIAFSAPDMLVSSLTFAIGALYIPTYLRIQDDKEKKNFNSCIFYLVLLICFCIAVLVCLFPSAVIKLFAGGLSDEASSQAAAFLRIMIWAAIPIGLGGVFKAYGQMNGRYSLMMALEVFINLSVILGLVVSSGVGNLTSFVFLAGTCLYALSAFLVIKRHDYKLSKNVSFTNPYFKMMALGFLPIFMSSAIAEINTIIDKNFASTLVAGTISSLHYSSKLVNLVTSLIGTAVTSVLFPELSKIMVKGDDEEISNSVILQNVLIIGCVLPVFYLVVFNSKLAVKILFARKSFGVDSVIMTSECLLFYSIAILGRNIKAVWIRVYNAFLDTKALAINALYALFFNVAMNFLLKPLLQHRGLALATGLSGVFSVCLLAIGYRKRNPLFSIKSLLGRSGRIVLLSLVYIPFMLIGRMYQGEKLLVEFLVVGCLFCVASSIFALLVYKFGGVEFGKGKRLSLKG